MTAQKRPDSLCIILWLFQHTEPDEGGGRYQVAIAVLDQPMARGTWNWFN